MKKPNTLLTIIAAILTLIPAVGIILNPNFLQDIRKLESVSGSSLSTVFMTFLTFVLLYLIFRFIYTPKEKRNILLISSNNFMGNLIFTTIALFGSLIVLDKVFGVNYSSNSAQTVSLHILIIIFSSLIFEQSLYSSKNRLSLEIFNDALQKSLPQRLVIQIFIACALGALAFFSPSNTPFFSLAILLSIWQILYILLVQPHLISEIVK